MMTEEEKLAKAYFVLGLEPGAPLDKIMRRHKRLIMVWHPDRFPTDDGKKDAEEELKQINNARDNLTNHFEKNHKANGACACKPTVGAAPRSNAQSGARSGPGPGKRKTTQESNREEEEEAQRRSKERQQKAAQEAAERERQKQAAASAAAATQTTPSTNQQTTDLAKLFEDEQLRWKIARYIGAAWIGLSLFGWLGTTIRQWIHH